MARVAVHGSRDVILVLLCGSVVCPTRLAICDVLLLAWLDQGHAEGEAEAGSGALEDWLRRLRSLAVWRRTLTEQNRGHLFQTGVNAVPNPPVWDRKPVEQMTQEECSETARKCSNLRIAEAAEKRWRGLEQVNKLNQQGYTAYVRKLRAEAVARGPITKPANTMDGRGWRHGFEDGGKALIKGAIGLKLLGTIERIFDEGLGKLTFDNVLAVFIALPDWKWPLLMLVVAVALMVAGLTWYDRYRREFR